MTIPLDKLYHYIESVARDIRGDAVIIYRFYPHGSKKLDDLLPLQEHSIVELATCPQIYCNDQEPLTYDYYKNLQPLNKVKQLLKKHNVPYPERNFIRQITIYDKCILLHSEKRSKDLKNYEDTMYIGAYYWSHAIIALDWFRYAQYDSVVKKITTKFLIYNRAWAGTREYRLKLVDLLIKANLVKDCQISVNPIDPELGIHYLNHKYINPVWRPDHKLEDYVLSKEVVSSASADYEIKDYEANDIELVLETLFDDSRLHLTEKILRPIALGQPFLLAATHGSLEYLRSYGFKTFATVIDESYDTIEDPLLRLEAIVKSMKEIASWNNQERKEKMILLNQIANYNRKHFFSKNFNTQVINELKTNLAKAIKEQEITNTSQVFIDFRKKTVKHTNIKEAVITSIPDRNDTVKILSRARDYYIRSLQK